MKLTLTAALLVSANYGWGTTSFCTTSPSYTQASSYNNSEIGSTGAGCYVEDKTFSDFTSPLGNGLTAVYVAGDESGYTNGLRAYNVSALFSGSSAGGPWTAGLDQVTGTFTLIADSANTYDFDTTYPTLPTASLITSITLSGKANTGADGSVNLSEEICIGAGACDFGAANSIELSGDFTGTIYGGICQIFGQVTGAACSPGSAVTFSSAVTSVTILADYSVGGTSTGTASLDHFEDTFGEDGTTPEPSTFVLLGSALAGLAALRLRKRSGKRLR